MFIKCFFWPPLSFVSCSQWVCRLLEEQQPFFWFVFQEKQSLYGHSGYIDLEIEVQFEVENISVAFTKNKYGCNPSNISRAVIIKADSAAGNILEITLLCGQRAIRKHLSELEERLNPHHSTDILFLTSFQQQGTHTLWENSTKCSI